MKGTGCVPSPGDISLTSPGRTACCPCSSSLEGAAHVGDGGELERGCSNGTGNIPQHPSTHSTPAQTRGKAGVPSAPLQPSELERGFAHQSWAGRALRTRWQHRDCESLVEAVLLGRALLEQLGRAPCFPLCRHSCIKQLTAQLYKGLRACWK